MLQCPAAERNCPHIVANVLEAVRTLLRSPARPQPSTGSKALTVPRVLLEVASGGGQHAAALSEALAEWLIVPTDIEEEAMTSIALRTGERQNVSQPRYLDVLDESGWAGVASEFQGGVDAILSVNMLHISCRAALPALLGYGSKALLPGGLLMLYGPFAEDGEISPESNVRFHESLRARNPEWGYRDTNEVAEVASAVGLEWVERVSMPANNLMIFLRKNADD